MPSPAPAQESKPTPKAGAELVVTESSAALPKPLREALAAHRATLRLSSQFDIEWKGGHRALAWARPTHRRFALVYSLGGEAQDTSEIHPHAQGGLHTFLHNYSRNSDSIYSAKLLDRDAARGLGADIIVRGCFVPALFLGDDFEHAVGFGLYKRNVGMTFLVMLSNDPTACASTTDPAIFGFGYVD